MGEGVVAEGVGEEDVSQSASVSEEPMVTVDEGLMCEGGTDLESEGSDVAHAHDEGEKESVMPEGMPILDSLTELLEILRSDGNDIGSGSNPVA